MKKKHIVPIFPQDSVLYGTGSYDFADPLGSYTGLPEDPMDKPVQDADDL